MTIKSSLFKQSGRKDLPEIERRKHSVNVRFNTQELSDLDQVRGNSRRAEALRLLAFSHFPAPIPVINSELRSDLGRCLGNLSTAAVAMRDGEYREITQLVIELREKLSVAVSNFPATIPAINSELRSDLGRCLGNLATIAVIARGGELIEVDEAKRLVIELRDRLAGAIK